MKRKFKISNYKYRIFLFVLFFGIVTLVRYAMSDMNLDVDLLRESLMKMPGIVMENINFSREISGDMWRVKIPYLDRNGNIINVKSLDVKRELNGDKGEWTFFGGEGVYLYDKKTASLKKLSGTLQTKNSKNKNHDRTWILESPQLDWKEEKNTFTFPEGLVIYDGEFLLRTPLASMDNSGVILLEKGGVIRWVKPLK